MSTLQAVELGVLGPLQVRQDGAPVMIPGAKPRAILTMLGLHIGSVVSAETLIDLLWGDDPPRTAAKALQTHISSLRHTLGDGFVLTEGTGWTLAESDVDVARYKAAARLGRDAAAAGDTRQAVTCFEEALALWRGIPELPDGRRGTSEKTRWIEGHAALVEDRADALLVTGRAAEIIGELEAAVADAPLRERRWGQLMLALYRAGRQGEALGAYQRARALLADELGVDPGPDLRRLEAAIVAQDTALEIPAAQDLPVVTRAVTFLLTDIEGSTAAWEADAGAMAAALARHDELVEQVVTSRGGRLIKTRGEGDATFSVFERPSAAAAAAIELQEAIVHEPWPLAEPMRIRVALHTGEVELRDGDYFGRAVNRAARLRSLAVGGQILCSGATAELVIDSLRDDVVLADLGMRELRNLARPEHVFELRLETSDARQRDDSTDAPMERPSLPAALAGPGPFVGRGRELERLYSAWQTVLAGGTNAVLIAGEPGVGKTRLAGEWSRQAYDLGALVIYGRCDEDLGAPYQPFAEALRSLVPCLGSSALRGLRGAEALLPLVPGLTDVLPDLAAPARADPDTERYALFDAVVALLAMASARAPVVLILDDLHWAAKPTLLLLRHLLRFGEQARVQIVGTYRGTDLDRSHPLAAMLADLHRDGTAERIQLAGLDEEDVTAYVTEAGYDDEELARALASVTGGNPFFLIEALRHVDESGGVWDPSTLPQGVREAVSRRLSRLPARTNKALAAAAVVGSRFALELVERVVEDDLVDAFDEACKAGIVIEEPGGRYRFNHAIVRQSLLAELPSVRRMRLHQRIATTLENEPGADDELLAELAHHYFECAWAGNAVKAVEYCRRAADQAMARLAYEGAADLYDRALHALEEIDDELPDRDDQTAELLVARCEALLAAGDVASAPGAVSQLHAATVDSARLAAWATCFDGQLSMLIHPERLDEVETALGSAAQKLAELNDAAGEAKAHTVRAACLARLGRIGDSEIALDDALTAARRSRDHRRVNAVLAGAPLAALWGPNPVPRAGGRCLDVVRLLRITTESPAVEATSTRCQAVLEAFRGRTAAARRMIDSARRTVTELGLRHALLEVEQFAGIVELVAEDLGAAEQHLRKAYNGFRRMGLDADASETAAFLGRACLAVDRDAEAVELCTESERLAGHALKPSIAWRALRALLLSRSNEHDEARRVAEAAVALAERTDALVDHGDACLTLATVLSAGGDTAGARAAAQRAVDLYEQKGAAALAAMARRILGEQDLPSAPAPPKAPAVEPDNACVRAFRRGGAVIDREAWDEFERLFAPEVVVESRRKIVGFMQSDIPSDWPGHNRRLLETSGMRITAHAIAVRGERLALARCAVGTADVSPGAPRDEFLQVCGIDEEGRISLQIWFDLEDMDAAIAELDSQHARFDAVKPQARRLVNAAALVIEQVHSSFAARDWDTMAQLAADNYSIDDRRRTANTGIRRGRDAGIKEMQATADVGFTTMMMLGALATRGERLVLTHVRVSGREPLAVQNDALNVVEIDADEKVVAVVVFDVEDFEAAIAELDARYLAGEAADHARTWSVITAGYAALNRHELPPTTPDWVNVDHRSLQGNTADDLGAYVRATWDVKPHARVYIEAVHRISDLGAVVTHAAHGTSQEGFDAEWRAVNISTIEGNLINRSELFDEEGLDAALARFEELSRPTPKLENAASQAVERYLAHFAARDWDALAQVLAHDISMDDRGRVVNAGIRHGRDAEISNVRATAGAGVTDMTAVVMAARGERLILARVSSRYPEEFGGDALGVVETNSHNQVAAVVVFDLDDFDAAIAELDARYLAGEAAAHKHTWSVIMRGNAAANRHETLPTTPDCVTIDHRLRATLSADDLTAYVRASWDLTPDFHMCIESVHRLTDLGAVVTHASRGTSQDDFDAEWRQITLLTVEGDLGNRCEIFDEADLDAALARFDQLSQPTPRLENAASQAVERYLAHFAAHDLDAMADLFAGDIVTHDRRQVANAWTRYGRDAELANVRAIYDTGLGGDITSAIVAARGERLILMRVSSREPGPERFATDVLGVVEVNSHNQITTIVVFDIEDFGAAIAELDARYLAGEAAPYARTWSLVAGAYAAINRRELASMTPDFVNIDHRRARAFAAGDLISYIRAGWDLGQDITTHIEAVHRLNSLGAVVTHSAHGTSQDGFDAEWRGVQIATVEADMINRSELFDETDLDVALATFDQLSQPTRRLENAASQAYERLFACMAARDWEAIREMTADAAYEDDRRRAVNAGIRHGRDAAVEAMKATVDVGFALTMLGVIATRGARLALMRVRASGRDPEAIQNESLNLLEVNADGRIVAVVVFDLDDFDAAIAELDARYLAGDAAAHAGVWSAVTQAYSALNRREPTAAWSDWVTIDHRVRETFEGSDLTAYIRAAWNLVPDTKNYIEAVHRLSNLGAVATHVAHGTSKEGFDAEWRMIELLTFGGDTINRCELFDEANLDAAIGKFEQLSRPGPRLENVATRVLDGVLSHCAARDWDAAAEMVADNICNDDRRRVVNAGIRHGRDAQMKDSQAAADVGFTLIMLGVIATRGARLALTRVRASSRDSESVQDDALTIVEVDTDDRIAAVVVFDVEDLDAALAELDARYLAGEAAAHAHSLSVITQVYAALNRHEMPATTPDWVAVDHRRGIAFAPGDANAYIAARQDPQGRGYVENVIRLSNLGAVFTWVGHATSHEGFEAEWRGVNVLTVDGDLINRGEIFDEADLDAALARFDELSRQVPRLENAATRVCDRLYACFAAREWDALVEGLADDVFHDDRRRVVGAGVRHGRDAVTAELLTLVKLGVENATSEFIATRGSRLVLRRFCDWGRGELAEEFHVEVLDIVEIDADERIVANISFDPDDFEAAIVELDARYLAGEAAPYAHTWSVITGGYATLNRRELPATTPDWVNVDHRRARRFASGDMAAYIRAGWDLEEDVRIYIETVHSLTNLGAVVTTAAQGISHEGFDAEWREIALLTVEEELINRCEMFEEADIDAAVARLDELSRSKPRLENAASRLMERFFTFFATGDWDAVAEIMIDDFVHDDRRPVVGAGLRHGRDANILDMRTTADLWITNGVSTVMATRGERLALMRIRVLDRHQGPEVFLSEALGIVEINADGRGVAFVTFDVDDFDTAIAELDARYLADEAAAHAHTWSVIARTYAAFNRHELPAADWVTIDHRRATPFASSTMTKSLRAMWDLTPDLNIRIESVHQLTSFGAVISHTGHGTSQEGFDAEWQAIDVLTLEGDRINRCEVFDEADLDAALARFEELHPQTPRLENAASQLEQRFWSCYATRDWDGMAELLSDHVFTDDRRRVVNAGVRHGRGNALADMRAMAEFEADITATVVAIRGERLVLTRVCSANRNLRHGEFETDWLMIAEIDTDERFSAHVVFDPNDIDAAFEELDTRYLAAEAAAHARTWSVVAGAYAALNRRELPPTTSDWVNIDHRRLAMIEGGDLTASIRAGWDLSPDSGIYVEAVHRLSDLGALVSWLGYGTSQQGFDAESQGMSLLTVDGDLISRCELFDEADLDAALARFDELDQPARSLENAATRIWARLADAFNRRDLEGFLALSCADLRFEDRRKGLRDEFEGLTAQRKAVLAMFGATPSSVQMTAEPIAIRGSRLLLTHVWYRDTDYADRPITVEIMQIVEVSHAGLLQYSVSFDPDDIDAAFEELDARYLAGEAAAHSDTWSVIVGIYTAFNRHQIAATTADYVVIDHRLQSTIKADDLEPYIRAAWDLVPNLNNYIETVHRLSELGAVVTNVASGTSQDGVDAEWRMIHLFTVEGDLVSRCEMFDEADLDAALARFDELEERATSFENAATRAWARVADASNRRDVDGLLALSSADGRYEDRRKGLRDVLEGPARQKGVQAVIGTAPTSWRVEVEPVAIRGDRLALIRTIWRDTDFADRPIVAEILNVGEVGDDDLLCYTVNFDPDDINGAFDELDARYLVGEAAEHAHTWSVLTRAWAAFNRHESPPMTPDSVNIDHRPPVTTEAVGLAASLRAAWDVTPDVSTYIEAVHRLSELGAVVTEMLKGTSHEGFDAEWRMINICTVEGDLISRCELFGDADLDAALARFDELSAHAAN